MADERFQLLWSHLQPGGFAQQASCGACNDSGSYRRCGCLASAPTASAGESLAAPGKFGLEGAEDLGGGCSAYLNPGPKLDGKWGYNNAGIVVGEGSSLVVDTLFDLPNTRQMLAAFDDQTRANEITALFNTHDNGDHTFGNQLVGGPDHPSVDIIASTACAAAFEPAGEPAGLARMMRAAKAGRGGPGLKFMHEAMGQFFDFEGVVSTPPTVTFDGSHTVQLDDEVKVELIEYGPAHTDGDAVAWVPHAKVLYAGDLLFVGGTPIVWKGPYANCECPQRLGR